jgi:hypothetical protein
MKARKHIKALGVVIGLLVDLVGCHYVDRKYIESDADHIPTSPAGEAKLSATPERLEFTHLVGKTGCPQVIGKVTVRNTGTAQGTATISVQRPLALPGNNGQLVPSTSVPVNAGQSIDVTVLFDCDTKSRFETSVVVQDGPDLVARIPVVGDVR